jgi:hypothetical protein
MKEREIGIEERMAGLLQPDTLLPSQYFGRLRRGAQLDGERRLMIAVLEDAVETYRKQAGARDGRAQQAFREAEEWIDDTDRTWLFSFENICDVLDINAEYVRRGLKSLKHRTQHGRTGEVVVALRPGREVELRKASGD